MVTYNPDWVKAYYDDYGAREWERWDRSPVERVKLAVHMHYLETTVQPGMRILEIGAGAGRFTQALARLGARVVVADISPVQLELNRENARQLGFAAAVEDWVECDMCALETHFADEAFDAVVCYGGPLSYVLERRDEALAELRRVARPGAPLLFGVMGLWGTVHGALPGVLALPVEVNRDVVRTGRLNPARGTGTHYCHMFRAAELRAALEAAGLAVEAISASNGLSAAWGEELAAIEQDPAKWAHLLELEFEACREPGCVDMGTHIIAVARKAPAAGAP